MSAQVSVAIIGAGAAGIGFAATLKSYGFRDFVVLEKGEVGDTFTKWNPETHLISPSFTTNGFGFPDLNAVVPDTSPAYSEGNEHLSGIQYAHYLKKLARKLELSVRTHTEVKLIRLLPDESYELKLSDDTVLTAQYVFIAIGDYVYPLTLLPAIKNIDLLSSSMRTRQSWQSIKLMMSIDYFLEMARLPKPISAPFSQRDLLVIKVH